MNERDASITEPDATDAPDSAAPPSPRAARDGRDPREMRASSPYTLWEKVKRVLWNYGGQFVFRVSFHDWYGARNALLRLFGAKIGRSVRIRPTVSVEQPWNLEIGDNSSVGDRVILYCLGHITIGDNCSISQYAHLCAGTHDHTRPDMPLVKLPIVLEDDVWLAADVFVGPGVRIGREAVIGARSSVYKDIEGGYVYCGNPAKPMKKRVYNT